MKQLRLKTGGTLYRRPSGHWWLDYTPSGKPRFRLALGTTDQALAREKALAVVGAAHRDQLDKALEALGLGNAHAMGLNEVVARYTAAAKVEGLADRSAHNNALALVRLATLGTGKEPKDITLADLTMEAMNKARAALLQNVEEGGMRKRRDRAIASYLRQANSIFSQVFLPLYGRVPDSLEEWTGARHRAEAKKYELPPELLRARTHAAGEEWGRIAKSDEPGQAEARVWRVAYLLGYRLGLRPGEIAGARWDWLEPQSGGGMALRVAYKRRTRRIPVAEGLLAELRELGHEDFILPVRANRKNAVEREFAAELRKMGWDARTYPKAAYELRKLAGSRWYTELGAERAAALLGHGNVAVTCQFYAALDRPITAAQVDGVFTQSGEVGHG